MRRAGGWRARMRAETNMTTIDGERDMPSFSISSSRRSGASATRTWGPFDAFTPALDTCLDGAALGGR